MKNKLQLIDFKTTDNLTLPGLLYEPEKKTNKVALFLHGNGSASIFYDKEGMELYSSELNSIGISFFPFNNRGAHWFKKLDKGEERIVYGMAYELIKECVHDIDGAINFLKKLGYKTFYLIGESTGANKIVVYNYYKSLGSAWDDRNPVSKYVLVSGGDDLSIYYRMFGRNRFFSVIEKCKEKINLGKGRDLVPKYILENELISYQSLLDTISPEGDYNIFPFHEYLNKLNISKKKLFKEFKTINNAMLVTYGEKDEFCYGKVYECVEVLKKEAAHSDLFTFKIIKDADHGYHGKEKELVDEIVNWLK